MTQISERARILVVDDEPANLKVIREVLANDYRLSFAKSGELALQLIENEPPKLILLDIMMPGMDGFEVCKKLKSDETLSRTPIIFITALTQGQDEEKGFKLGAVDYITKPVSPSITLARVKTHISLANQMRVTENIQ